jgi:hypothetical protein
MACACGYRFRIVGGRVVGNSIVAESRESASSREFVAGALATGAIAFLMGYFESDMGPALLAAIVGGIAIALWLKRRQNPEVRVRYLTRESRSAFETAEQLQGAKGKLMVSRTGHMAALKSRQELRRRLVSLREKMKDLGLPAYAPRIASIDAALVMLDRQIDMSTRLRDGYDKSITMIDIELESGVAADAMNEDIGATIAAAMDELKDLEESQAELGRQLEANVEVEQLLRPRAS